MEDKKQEILCGREPMVINEERMKHGLAPISGGDVAITNGMISIPSLEQAVGTKEFNSSKLTLRWKVFSKVWRNSMVLMQL